MIKIIRVGDPHVTARNLLDSQKLMDFVAKQAQALEVDRVEFMGDLFHTHAVKRIEVENFWLRVFKHLTNQDAGIDVLALVGNHDQPGSKELSHMSALDVFKPLKGVTIVDKPKIVDGIGYAPYTYDHKGFIDIAKKLYSKGAQKVIVAHQTFIGAKYDNGFYAPDGIELESIPQEHIISGHIHDRQIIGKCHYIGTPKWDTMSDANKEKAIWYYEHDTDGSVLKAVPISTKDVVTPIVKYTIKEGDGIPELNPKAKNFVELVGKTAWIKQAKKKLKGKAGIKTRPLDRKKTQIDKEKVMTLIDFLNDHFEPIDGVTRNQINQFLKEKINVG